MPSSFRLLGHVLLVGSIIASAHGIQQNSDTAGSRDAAPNAIPPQSPLQVKGLVATPLDSTQAEVKWLKPAGPVRGYSVRVCAIVTPIQCQEWDTNETHTNLHQLKPNTTYEVQVRAFDNKPRDAHGEEAVVSFTTLPPPKLDDFEVHPLNSTSVEITWKAVTGARFVIEICRVPSKDQQCRSYRTGSHISKFIIDSLEPGTLYTVHASFSTLTGGLSYPGMHISRNFTTPAIGDGENSGSLSPISGLLLISSLFYVVMREAS